MNRHLAKLYKALDAFFFNLSHSCFQKKETAKNKAIESAQSKLVRIAEAKVAADKAHDEAVEMLTKEYERAKEDTHRRLNAKRGATLNAIAALEDL